MIPEGYEKLAVIGIAWKGNYADGTAYKLMNAVYYEGSTFVALKDDPVTPPVADNTNWTYLAKGFAEQLLSAVTALDTSGVIGTAGEQVGAQVLMDAIADKVMTKLLAKSQIVNNLLATDPTTVLAAPMGKSLSDKCVDLQNKYTQLNSELRTKVNKVGDVMGGTLKIRKISPVNTQAWQFTHIHLNSNNTNDPSSRPGIGFENEGIIAGTLYFDIDGTFKLAHIDGRIFVLNMTQVTN